MSQFLCGGQDGRNGGMVRRLTSPGMRDDRYKRGIQILVERRKELGLSQQAIADALGLHRQFVSRVELGERRLDFVELLDYTLVLDVDLSEFLHRVGNDC